MRGASVFIAGERESHGRIRFPVTAAPIAPALISEVAVILGVEPLSLNALMVDVDTAPIDKRFRPIFKFLKKLTLTPYKMIQADADAVYAEGWDERALHDIIRCAAAFRL